MKKIMSVILFTSISTHAFEWREFLGSLLQGKLQLGPESNNGYDLSERQAHDYVDHIADSFYTSVGRRLQKRTTQDILFLIKQAIRRSQQPYITAQGKTYSKELIDQYIVRALIEYCEKTAFTYAYKQTRNQNLSQEIAILVRNQLIARINHKILDFEKLILFLDEGLHRFVEKELMPLKNKPEVHKTNNTKKVVHNVPNMPAKPGIWDDLPIRS